MKRLLTFALVAGVAVTACKDNPTAAPIDAPTVDALKNLTRTTLQQLAIGVTAQDRGAFASTATVVLPGILSRDVYRIDASEPRYVIETLGGQADPGSFAGGSGFATFYTGARAANNAIVALRTPPANTFTTGEVAAARGFFRTMKAIEFYRVLEQRDSIGIPLQTDAQQEITPIYCKPFVMNYLAALLDSAAADFTAAGAAELPFDLPKGWNNHGRNYQSAAALLLFNRAWKGKIDFYRAMQNRSAPDQAILTAAVAELTQALQGQAPGAVPANEMPVGVYYEFDAAELLNIRADQKISANNYFADSARRVTSGPRGSARNPTYPWDSTDTRLGKIILRPDSAAGGLVGQNLATYRTYSFAVANTTNQLAPLPMLKDEEIVLLRAQANAERGNLALAYADAQSVHAAYGSIALAPFTSLTQARFIILREKRLSLAFEGPQRLVDLRAYGYLNATYLPAEIAGDPFNSTFPIPRAELNARGGSVGACSAS